MSGDVQPRKRKDKKRKKDELGVEEPRGTAAALGEGDIFIHSYHDHGTGGHWCAKIIFFSLLAVLITLIGLIILENRGLSELEANSVESRYSGVLEGWIEDAPDDDHHDEHTLELKHHDHLDDDEQDVGGNHQDDDEELEHDEENSEQLEQDDNDGDASQEDDVDDASQQDDEEDDEDEVEELDYRKRLYIDEEGPFDENEGNENSNLDEDKEENQDENNNLDDEQDYLESYQNYRNNEDDVYENNDDDKHETYYEAGTGDDDDDDDVEQTNNEEEENVDEQNDNNAVSNENKDDDEHDEDGDNADDEQESEEVEKLENENSDEEPISTELPALPEKSDRDDDDDDVDNDVDNKDDDEDSIENQAENDSDNDVDDDDDEFLEQLDEDDDGPPVEKITVPSGQPFDEIEEAVSSEKPPNTLDEEEEFEKKQEELRREEEQKSSQKDGGNSMEDYWPSEPSDPFWHQQLDEAERDLLRGRLESALSAASAVELKSSARARWIIAQSLDKMAEAKRDNKILTQAITAYLEVLKMNQHMPDKKLLEVASRALNRIQFRGTYLSAEPVYRLLIRRFPDQVDYRNNLTITFLMAGRADLAEGVLRETLTLWPKDRIALAHLGFVLKTEHNRLEEAVELFKTALEGDSGPACEPRFYYHYGDALLLLGRFAEAHEVHKRGAAHGHFLSPEQRSLYNVERLKSRPWWDIEKQTPYANLARALEKSWREILKEGEAAKALYEKEKEGLRERGEWSQLDLFVRGQEIPGRCKQAPVTCSIVKSEVAAIRCRRGQIKFSSMEPGTHVRPHVGPTNCRLRMHLGLKNTKDTYIRVHKETRQWREGKVLLFDDSFEHEVWHNGTGTRLVLIVDVWHPDLTANERRQLPAI